MEISNLVEKIEKELEARSQALDAREASVSKKEARLTVQSATLSEKEAQIALQTAELEPKLAKIAQVESKLKSEKEVAEGLRKIAVSEEQSRKALKLAEETVNDANVKLADLTRRELALSARESAYREEIKKEFVDKFLGK